MLQKSGSRNLAAESLDVLFGSKLPGQNHFQRDNALETELAGAINHAHPTTGNFFEQFVITKATDRFLAEQGTPGTSCRIS